MKNTSKILVLSILMIFVVMMVGFATQADALPILHFDQTEDGGKLTWAGEVGNSPMIGTQIKFGTITGEGTPLNDGMTLEISSGFLNFSTGDWLSKDGSGGPGTIYKWDGGGEFTLTGTVDYGTGPVTGELLTGEWAYPVSATVSLAAGTTFGGSGFDAKHPDLLDYFGLETYADFIFSNTEISTSGDWWNGNDALVSEADITNTGTPIPEPATMLLLGSGLIGLAGLRRRFKK